MKMGFKNDSKLDSPIYGVPFLPIYNECSLRPKGMWQALLWIPMMVAGIMYSLGGVFLIFYEYLEKKVPVEPRS